MDSIERISKSNDVFVSGIPRIPNEDIKGVVNKLAELIECPLAPVTPAFRVRVSKTANDDAGISSQASPIVLKFAGPHEKMQFIRAVRRKKPKISQLGFAGNNSVFVRESLSTINQELFKAAMIHRRNGIFTTVFTNHGFVYVRRSHNKDEIPRKVVSHDQLSSLATDTSSA